MKQVLIIGSAANDTIVQGSTSRRKMGGAVVYGGLTFRRLGVATRVVTNVAPQDRGFRDLFARESIDGRFGPTKRTTTFVDRVDGDDRSSSLVGVAPPITARQVSEALEGVDLVHLGPLHPHDLDDEVLDLLGRRGVPVSLDLQGYVRETQDGGGEIVQRASPSLAPALALASIVKAGREEAAEVMRATGRTLRDLAVHFGIDELVVTAASQGGRVVCSSGEEIEYAAVPTVERDPTGAGDVFFATYLVSRLRDGLSPRLSCARAAATASRHVAGEHIVEATLALPEA
jgi:sugar/nucleoside kinase (ribokinase family)